MPASWELSFPVVGALPAKVQRAPRPRGCRPLGFIFFVTFAPLFVCEKTLEGSVRPACQPLSGFGSGRMPLVDRKKN